MKTQKFFRHLGLAGIIALGGMSVAQAQDHDQPPSPPQVINQAAGKLGETLMYARVASDGSHVSGQGGLGLLSSARLSTGNYEVIFRRRVSQDCVFIGGVTNDGFGIGDAVVDVVLRSGNDNGLFVQTKDLAGSAADRDFSVFVYCNT